VGADEDKRRAISAREQRQLRATVAEEPSSSYAYHDEERVEQVRTPGASRPANDTSVAPKPRFSKSTMVGGHQAPIASLSPGPSIRTATPVATKRRALSEPPDIGSWPPLPNVPEELAGIEDVAPEPRTQPRVSVDPRRSDPDELEEMQTAPPRRPPSATPPSGSIWGATPPVVGSVARGDDRYSDEPPRDDDELSDAPGIVIPELGGPPEAPAPVVAAKPAYRDPEIEKLEQLVERGAWETLAKELRADASRSAAYRLMHVIALRETLPHDDKGGAGHKLTHEAIVAIAEMLGVPESSPTALMLAKRLLRRNPVWVQKQPDARVSFGVVVVGLLIGVGIGWALMRFVM